MEIYDSVKRRKKTVMLNISRPVVSIICNTYNHKDYIEEAINGFLIQKTSFPYEVLIHDDASTDGTAEIIKQYEEKYPNIIKPIYQKENQYSRGVKIGAVFQYPRVDGKYIALCEGDDYWTDPLKLQKQYDLMENNPQVDMCAHASTRIDAKTGKYIRTIRAANNTCILSVNKVILGGGGFVSTNSLFFRTELIHNMPQFRKMLGIDYTMQVHGSLRGGLLYIDDNMSVYRANVENSWVDRMKKDPHRRAEHKKKCIKMLVQMNKDTRWKHTVPICRKICEMLSEYIVFSFKSIFLHIGIK